MSRLFSREKIVLLGIIALAACFRLFRLDQLPPGLQFDQAFYVFDVIRLLQGQFAIFFAAPGGTEPLYIYLAMVGGALFGATAFGLKLTGAVIGVLTIPLLYGLVRAMFQSARVAGLAAFFAAISLWHIFFARYGERVTLLVLLTILVYWFFWRALEQLRRRDFLLTGIFLALALYTYPGARVVPIAVVVLAAYTILTRRAQTKQTFQGLLITCVTAAFLFSPLAIYLVMHPDEFIGHTAQVSIFVPHGLVPTDVPTALVTNALRLLGMFFVVGDGGIIRNAIPGRPIFDPFVGGLFAIGGLLAIGALLAPRTDARNRKRAAFIAVWIASTLALSLFSDDAPNFVRTLPALPAVMILPAWGADEIWKRARGIWVRRAVAILFVVGLLASTAFAYRDYFINFANDPGTYYAFDTDKVELSNWINQNAPTQKIFLAPVVYQVGTVSLLTRNAPLKSFESRDTIVLPVAEGHDAVFAFPLEQDKKLQTLAARLGELGATETLTGTNGAPFIRLFRVPAQNLPSAQHPLDALARGGDFIHPQKIRAATWGDEIELLGYSVDALDTPKRNLQVTLFLRALKPMTTDYTFSIKVRDSQDRVWGQEDKWAGDNSYATTQWSPGEIVIEKFYPGLSACAPADDYRLTVETYDPKTGRVATTAEGNTLVLGTTRADAAPSNRIEDLEIAQPLEVGVAPDAQLLGYTLTPNEARAGDAFALSLFWRGVGDGTLSRRVSLRLNDLPLVEKNITLPPEGRGLCTLFDLRTPANTAPGTYTLFVNDVKISTLNLVR